MLGGYGHFGTRIVRALAADGNVEVIVAGRSASRQGPAIFVDLPQRAQLQYADLDSTSPELGTDLSRWQLCTGDPYRRAVPGPGLRSRRSLLARGCPLVWTWPTAAISCAGSRPASIATARAASRAAITGASTLPAISSAVVDALRDRFDPLHEIDIVIAPAHRTPLGLATVRAVLSYCGVPFQCWRDGRWQETVGWRRPQWVSFPHLRPRLASPCDVPDHDLLLERYPGVRSVSSAPRWSCRCYRVRWRRSPPCVRGRAGADACVGACVRTGGSLVRPLRQRTGRYVDRAAR